MRAWRSKRSKAETHVDAFSFAPPPFAPAQFTAPAPPSDVAARPVEATFVETPGPESANVETPNFETVPAGSPPGELTAAVDPLAMQSEFLRLLAVVTSMCDHVIEYIEADRAERRVMIETLAQLSRVIGNGPSASAPVVEIAAEPTAREHVIGGSMDVGPEPFVDLRTSSDYDAEPDLPLGMEAEIPLGVEPEIKLGIETFTTTEGEIEIAVEVRGRFGDRWVDGFEICEVMATPDGPRYRLRRHRDGVVLPELFDATSIRHVETFEELRGDQLDGSQGYWSRS